MNEQLAERKKTYEELERENQNLWRFVRRMKGLLREMDGNLEKKIQADTSIHVDAKTVLKTMSAASE